MVDSLVPIHDDNTFPARVTAAINTLIAAGIVSKADAATVTTALAGKAAASDLTAEVSRAQAAEAAKAPLASPTFTGTVSGITAAMVGAATTAQGAKADSAVQPAAMTTAINAAVSNLVNGAPGALDQLNELAAALGNDANFATTVTNALASKVNSSTYTAGLAGKADALSALAPVSIDGELVVNKLNRVDASSAARSMTLPTSIVGAQVAVAKDDSTSNAVTVTGNIRGVPGSTLTLYRQHQGITLVSDGAGSWVPLADHNRRTVTASDPNVVLVIDPPNGYTPATGEIVLRSVADGVPAGGTAGQVLTKVGTTDYVYGWAAPSGGGSGGGALTTAAAPARGSDATGLTGTNTMQTLTLDVGTWLVFGTVRCFPGSSATTTQQVDIVAGTATMSVAGGGPTQASGRSTATSVAISVALSGVLITVTAAGTVLLTHTASAASTVQANGTAFTAIKVG